MTEYLTNVSDVEYPSGARGPCYALVGVHGTGSAVSVRRAMELQCEGVPFRQPHPVYPADFATWFGPDFPQVNEPHERLAKDNAERAFGETVDHTVEIFGPDWTRSTQTVEGVRIQLDVRPADPSIQHGEAGLSVFDDVPNRLPEGETHAIARMGAEMPAHRRITVRICDQVKRGPRDVADLVSRALRMHLAGIASARPYGEVSR